MSQHFAQTSSV